MTFSCICNIYEDMSKSHPIALEDHVGYWLRCLSNQVSHSFAARVERHGVSVAQWVVLRTLYDQDNISLVEAAKLVGVDKSSLSRMMERLVAKKLVTRMDSKDDGRAMRLTLSPAGRKLVPVLAKEADDNDHAFFKALSNTEREKFLKTVTDLLHAHGWSASTHGPE